MDRHNTAAPLAAFVGAHDGAFAAFPLREGHGEQSVAGGVAGLVGPGGWGCACEGVGVGVVV